MILHMSDIGYYALMHWKAPQTYQPSTNTHVGCIPLCDSSPPPPPSPLLGCIPFWNPYTIQPQLFNTNHYTSTAQKEHVFEIYFVQIIV